MRPSGKAYSLVPSAAEAWTLRQHDLRTARKRLVADGSDSSCLAAIDTQLAAIAALTKPFPGKIKLEECLSKRDSILGLSIEQLLNPIHYQQILKNELPHEMRVRFTPPLVLLIGEANTHIIPKRELTVTFVSAAIDGVAETVELERPSISLPKLDEALNKLPELERAYAATTGAGEFKAAAAGAGAPSLALAAYPAPTLKPSLAITHNEFKFEAEHTVNLELQVSGARVRIICRGAVSALVDFCKSYFADKANQINPAETAYTVPYGGRAWLHLPEENFWRLEFVLPPRVDNHELGKLLGPFLQACSSATPLVRGRVFDIKTLGPRSYVTVVEPSILTVNKAGEWCHQFLGLSESIFSGVGSWDRVNTAEPPEGARESIGAGFFSTRPAAVVVKPSLPASLESAFSPDVLKP